MRFYQCFFIGILLALLASCDKGIEADAIYWNGTIYTCDSAFGIVEAFAIKDGKFVAVGSNEFIKSKYHSKNTIDLSGKTVYPGLFDAHCHFYALGKLKSECDVAGAPSWQAVIDSVSAFIEQHPNQLWIVGRGWDQTRFANKEMPNNEAFNKLFPNKAILMRRIDGHGAVANTKALAMAGITPQTKINGGEVGVKNGKLSGFLLDNAVDLVIEKIPKPTSTQMAKYLLKAQELCLAVGLTSVVDAGLAPDVIQVIDSLYKTGALKIRINAMLSATPASLAFAKRFGAIDRPEFRVKSFKIYTDGALGSRGALLKKEYCDRPGHHGLLLTEVDTIKKYCQFAMDNQFQVCAHAIGDSANRLILDLFGQYSLGKDVRWRIEHAQVVDANDFQLFGKYGIVPSVQPTHATSDMRWAEERVCSSRMVGAYAYQSLLQQLGYIALGTDFPIEDYKPIKTFYAAVYRQDDQQQPQRGFRKAEGLTAQQALLGMTNWAAYAQFDENTKGQIAHGYWADFVIAETDFMQLKATQVLAWKPWQVLVAGK